MVARASSRRWLSRQIRPTYVVVVSVACIVAILTYFVDWPTFVSGPMPRHERAAQPANDNGEQGYTGSIIIPSGGGLCWRYILDNRTGGIRYGGHPRCVEATSQFDKKVTRENLDRFRLREVGKAFRHENN
jgi:hypothetical protein